MTGARLPDPLCYSLFWIDSIMWGWSHPSNCTTLGIIFSCTSTTPRLKSGKIRVLGPLGLHLSLNNLSVEIVDRYCMPRENLGKIIINHPILFLCDGRDQPTTPTTFLPTIFLLSLFETKRMLTSRYVYSSSHLPACQSAERIHPLSCPSVDRKQFIRMVRYLNSVGSLKVYRGLLKSGIIIVRAILALNAFLQTYGGCCFKLSFVSILGIWWQAWKWVISLTVVGNEDRFSFSFTSINAAPSNYAFDSTDHSVWVELSTH